MKREQTPGCRPQAEAPNSVPSHSRFETSTEPYAYGGIGATVPAWLIEQAKRRNDLEDAKEANYAYAVSVLGVPGNSHKQHMTQVNSAYATEFPVTDGNP